jgi:hypothetical protein
MVGRFTNFALSHRFQKKGIIDYEKARVARAKAAASAGKATGTPPPRMPTPLAARTLHPLMDLIAAAPKAVPLCAYLLAEGVPEHLDVRDLSSAFSYAVDESDLGFVVSPCPCLDDNNR